MIHWNPDPEILHIGPFILKWYSLFFILSFLLGYVIIVWIYKKENLPEKYVDELLIYVFFGTLIGARLGHCLFYEPSYYFSNPLEIVKVWRGGLASHGAAVGILTALYLYLRNKPKQTYLWLVDRVVIVVALSGFFIRMGNLFNSEIVGKPASVAWAFIFSRIDNVPRHPAQLYEALAYLCIFGVLFGIYKKKTMSIPKGFLFGIFLIGIFAFRFFVEFLKENQSSFEAGMVLNMGQLLSIPFVLLGIFLVMRVKMKNRHAISKN